MFLIKIKYGAPGIAPSGMWSDLHTCIQAENQGRMEQAAEDVPNDIIEKFGPNM